MTYLSPGVYIEEVPSGPQPIAAAPTSVLALIGKTQRGPVGRPVRVTNWSEYTTVFGGSIPDSYTAESVYGFFANGGPAVYVLRADQSIGAVWNVTDAAGALSFPVTAISPGAWGNGIVLGLAPSEGDSGGSGTLFAADVTAPATIGTGASATADIVLSTTAGLVVNQPLTVSTLTGVSRKVTVAAVSGDTVSIKAAEGATPATALAAGDRVAAGLAPNSTTIRFASANGIRVGDVLVARRPAAAPVSWLVSAVAAAGAGLEVTVDPVAGAVDGTAFADATMTLAGTTTAPLTEVGLADIAFTADKAFIPTAAALKGSWRATAQNGLVGAWNDATGTRKFVFPAEVPAGTITVDLPAAAIARVETSPLGGQTLATLTSAFGWIPDGSAVELVAAAGGTDVTITKQAGVFTAPGTPDYGQPFVSQRIVYPQKASSGIVLRTPATIAVGDRLGFGTTTVTVASVEHKGNDTVVAAAVEDTDLSAVPAGTVVTIKRFVDTRFTTLRFSLSATTPLSAETFPDLALDPRHPRYFARDGVINGVSTLVTVAPRPATAGAPSPTTTPAAAAVRDTGADVALQPRDIKNAIPALEGTAEPALLAAPDIQLFSDPLAQADLVNALVVHAEEFRRFVVVDAPDLGGFEAPTALAQWRLKGVSSTSAATYAPFVSLASLDPASNSAYRSVPPSGFVAGVMARTDLARGVYKAPANEVVNGIVGLASSFTQRQQDVMNPAGVNVIRAFPGRGIRVWGARNATDDAVWRYVNVRRLFNMIETSVERSTQWVVFEPNTAATWLRIRVSIENFLEEQRLSGALAGESASQAYRVRVGLGQTMTESQIELGLVITEVAVAPARPAEFVVFRFSHKRLAD